MRFDDSLKTVLAADTSTAFGARAAFRQLTDLLARRRAPADQPLLDRLVSLRDNVPAEVRAGVARGLALADPPAPLVRLFATDEPDVASAVLRAARLSPEDWDDLIPAIGPVGRSILRRRDDLPPSAQRALEAFGTTDFALADAVRAEEPVVLVDEPAPAPAEPVAIDQPPAPAIGAGPFRAIGELATGIAAAAEQQRAAQAPVTRTGERFEIADLVHRIEEFQRDRVTPAAAAEAPVIAFRFETDVDGVIRWIDSAPRGAIIGTALSHASSGRTSVDGVAAGAYRKRATFTDARLVIGGSSPLAGDWRIAGVPVFEQSTGRFLGYRGSARRPRIEEDAARVRASVNTGGVEGLRRLVHELRTPTNAIAGFSELIERELLGPVPQVYRDRAATIRAQVSGLIGAIEDLDLAARIEGAALDLRPRAVSLQPVLTRVAEELAPLAERRGSQLLLPVADAPLAVAADPLAIERLLSRLLATLLSASRSGEMFYIALSVAPGDMVALSVERPAAFAGQPEAKLLALDEESGADDGGPLLGVGFALRLVRNLAAELGGRLAFDAACLTLTLPAALNADMDQASTAQP